MGKLVQVWLSYDNVPFETEKEMLAHEEIAREVKLAKNYKAFLDYQVSGSEYETHPEDLRYLGAETIEMVIEHLQYHLQRHPKTRET